MVTRLFFHLASSGLSSLPTVPQSSLAISAQADASGINRVMNITIGTGFTTAALTSRNVTTQQNQYYARFLSPKLDTTTITATTWKYEFAGRESNTNANCPVAGNNVSTWAHLYVWDTSTGTKATTILDGGTNSNFGEFSTSGQHGDQGTFVGTTVTGLASTHVLIFEVWFRPVQGMAAAYTDSFYYDGTTDILTDASNVSDPASFIETPQNLTFVSAGGTTFTRTITETTAISETLSRRLTGLRSATETTAISESVSRAPVFARSITETTAISETLTRLYRGFRTITETTAISETLTKLKRAFRTIAAETVAISETLTGKKVVGRSITETTSISESVSRLLRSFRTITETNTISETLTRVKTGIRTISETVAISETLTRLYRAFRTITETVVITETLTGVKQGSAELFQHCLASLRHMGRR